jgi:hypothetical protein
VVNHARREDGPEKVYPTYRPYPVTWGSERLDYPAETGERTGRQGTGQAEADPFDGVPDLIGDPPAFEWHPCEPPRSNGGTTFRPLGLLQSLFADRLNFLERALDELEAAGQERQRPTRHTAYVAQALPAGRPARSGQ